jgi:DNA-binding LacI/PurR family transcriptional regulator
VAAVEHLIAHGHTRIGFVTIRNLSDAAERLAAYGGTLQAHGLAADPKLVFTAPENSERGGAHAAHAVLAGPRPPSALMVAADPTAIGLMRVLTDSGLAIPRDIAVMAFDNIEAGSFSGSRWGVRRSRRTPQTAALVGDHLYVTVSHGPGTPGTLWQASAQAWH